MRMLFAAARRVGKAAGILFGLGFLLCVLPPTRAVIFYSTSDPTYNTTPPKGDLTNSGWELQGFWGPFLGTPVSSNFFLTAKHVGGSIGETFVFGGENYIATDYMDDPSTDLRLWKVCGTFPRYALLSTNSNEFGSRFVVFGRGTQRGDPVVTTNGLRGWQWGFGDTVMRWGENTVAGFTSAFNLTEGFGETGLFSIGGELLKANFRGNQGTNEVHLSNGDSGGGIFIKNGNTWALAGINYSVDGLFNTTNSGPGFNAAIFDARGLYYGTEGNWTLVGGFFPIPSAFYATRVAPRVEWIQQVLSSSIALPSVPVLQAADFPQGPYADYRDIQVDPVRRLITLTAPDKPVFLRLRGCSALRISEVQFSSGQLTVRYE